MKFICKQWKTEFPSKISNVVCVWIEIRTVFTHITTVSYIVEQPAPVKGCCSRWKSGPSMPNVSTDEDIKWKIHFGLHKLKWYTHLYGRLRYKGRCLLRQSETSPISEIFSIRILLVFTLKSLFIFRAHLNASRQLLQSVQSMPSHLDSWMRDWAEHHLPIYNLTNPYNKSGGQPIQAGQGKSLNHAMFMKRILGRQFTARDEQI